MELRKVFKPCSTVRLLQILELLGKIFPKCDDWATVGSANLDTLSMRINRELNLSFNDPNHVRSLIENFRSRLPHI